MSDSKSKPAAICLMGPTSSGKTAMALELVDAHPFEIINVDSAQVYRGMDIGTGKPDKATLARVQHRLMDIRDPSEPYSASDFRSDAIREIQAILAAGNTPLLVGGTMLYFKALKDGLAPMPEASPKVRAEIEAAARSKGWDHVHAWLAEVDPDSAARIHKNDPQRLQRALEVYLVSGQTMTEYHRQEAEHPVLDNILPFNLHCFGIQPQDRSVLHSKIEQRFLQMLGDGLLEEVRLLYQRGDLHESLPSVKSVGYRQVWQYLAGEIGYDEMVEKSIIATRQLAKRQLTWLRGWDKLQSLRDPSAKSIAKVLNYVDSISI